jgi:hypothetical protein
LKRKILIVIIPLVLLTFFGACNKGNNSQGTTQTGVQKVVENANTASNSLTNKANIPSSAAATSATTMPTSASMGLQNETNEERIKRQTYNYHKGLLDILILKKNPTIPPVFFSTDYVNIITGEKKLGLNSKFFQDFYTNDNVYKVTDISKLVDSNKSETLTYDEIMKSPEKCYVKNKANFQYKQGDVLAIIPPIDGSPLKDGWIGVYRMFGKQKKMVAGSF